jgi:hypothetical protein
MQGRTDAMEAPLVGKIEVLNQQQKDLNDKLKAARDKMERMVLVFLDNESLFASENVGAVAIVLGSLEVTIGSLKKAGEICKDVLKKLDTFNGSAVEGAMVRVRVKVGVRINLKLNPNLDPNLNANRGLNPNFNPTHNPLKCQPYSWYLTICHLLIACYWKP